MQRTNDAVAASAETVEPTQDLDALLVSPPIFYEGGENIWKEVNSNFPPLGLASMAAVLRENGFSVRIIDCNVEAPSVQDFDVLFEQLSHKYRSIRFIGITSMTPTIKKAYRLAQMCRQRYPDSTIVFGGVHPTFMSEEVLDTGLVDIVVIGEGERTFLEIVKGKDRKGIDGIAYRLPGSKKTLTTKPRERIAKLDELPMPAYDLLPIRQYRPAAGTYKRLPAMSMMTSRGCPGRCTFCSKTLGYLLVFKSAEKIFAEIKYLVATYGIKQILFYDDTLTVHKTNIHKLCDLIIQDRMDISWTCFARVDFVDYPLLKKMRDAGCHQVMYGVENINTTVIQNIRKNINVDQVRQAVRWTKQAGIECRLAFMVGNPGDTKDIILENVRFVNEVNPDLLIVNITTPFPGTEMYKWADEKGLLLTKDWDDYDLSKPVMRLENMSVEDIKGLYKLMYSKFYFRPGYMVSRLFKVRSFQDLKVMLEGGSSLVSFLFPKNLFSKRAEGPVKGH